MNALLPLVLGAAVLPGFPKPAGGPVAHAAVGLLLDGQPAVVLVAGDKVNAFRADGTRVRGFPLALGAGESASGAPAAEVGRDGAATLAVATASGKLHLWRRGKPVAGYPAALGAPCRAGPSFADVDGDGKPEVLVGDARGRLHAFGAAGREPPGWPVALRAPVTSSASSSRFGGGRSLAVGLANGEVHVLALPGGGERPGFPLATGFEVSGAPAFADLDEDGRMDLLVASQDYKLHAVNERGKPLPGFPVETGYRLYGGPAVADLDGDGRLDVAFASADGFVHAVSSEGSALPGFPVRAGNRIFGGVVLGDLDGDGRPDLVAASAEGQVVALSSAGKALAGFPTRLDAQDLSATPLLFDLAGDRGLSAFVGVATGELHALRAPERGSVPATAPWPVQGRDATHSGRFGPHPPRYSALAIVPPLPTAGARLEASWRWASPDAGEGDPEPVPHLEWYRNGAPVPELRDKKEVPPGRLGKGERWRFAIFPPGAGAPMKSPEVTATGSGPAGHEVALEPARPVRGQPVRAVLVRKAGDPDGDPVSYRYEWLLDGQAVEASGDQLPAHHLKRGSAVAVRVRASDGESESEPVTAEGRVANSPPGRPQIALTGGAASDPVEARVTVPAVDADEDPLVYRHRWTVDGEERNLASSTASLRGGTLRKHQKVRVEVRAFDGLEEGPPATGEVTVRNAPPTAPAVSLRPARPRRGEPVRAVVAPPALDPDGDPLTHRFAWKRNGKPLSVPGDGRELPADLPRRGDRLEVEVWANDGEVDGPRARASAEVRNSPPTAPVVALQPERPRGGESVRLVIVKPGVDPDGDPVTYAIAWTRDGKALADKGEVLPPDRFRKNERIRATVTATDGTDAGPPAFADFQQVNTPPGRPTIALEPAEPTARTGIEAVVRIPSTDRDGDPVTYRYAWQRDGVPASVDGPRVAPGRLRHGEIWTVTVRPYDGEEPGEPATATALVRNTPPPAAQVAITPLTPVAGQALRCEVSGPARDADGEPLEPRVRWTRAGQAAVAAEGPELPAGLVKRDERWRCEGWLSDGEAEGPGASAEVTIRNSPPGAPKAAIEPEAAHRGDALSCLLSAEAVDPDGDRVRYGYAWWRDDQPVVAAGGGSRVDGKDVRKGQRWRCQVTPSDGATDGEAARAERVIQDSPPGPARVRLLPASPRPGDTLRCEVTEPSADPDGDQVRYGFAWVRNGEPQGFSGASDSVPGRLVRAGDRWRCLVTPTDGELSGPAAASAETTVGSAPRLSRDGSREGE